ncbi:MAG: CHAT domain-containing protein [Candidatus Caldatribacteriaceae bacterium]
MVLSACETALGQYSVTEGLIGFTRSFFYAGAPSLIASLWSVSDLSTRDLFVGFYRYLQGGLPKVEALWRAQIDVAKAYPHPYFWAPFILIGREK